MLLDPKKTDTLQLKNAPQADKQKASGGNSSSDYDSLFK
jgi:hypothetical protein